MKINITVSVDLPKLLKATKSEDNNTSVIDLVKQELGWILPSGLIVENIKEISND
jgi:hypothetical protein